MPSITLETSRQVHAVLRGVCDGLHYSVYLMMDYVVISKLMQLRLDLILGEDEAGELREKGEERVEGEGLGGRVEGEG